MLGCDRNTDEALEALWFTGDVIEQSRLARGCGHSETTDSLPLSWRALTLRAL